MGHQIFDITMTKIEAMAEPDGISNNFRRDRWRMYIFDCVIGRTLSGWELTLPAPNLRIISNRKAE
jgi:hypothetical protein|tara:strand:+ start:168 stop:365 length:198 start_codon:yes stop_codon:yes gene_type:complete